MPVASVTRTRLVLTRHPVVGPRSEEVGGVRQLAQRDIAVAVPMGQEEVAAVVADLQQPGVHGCDLGDVRRIQDHLAAVGDDGLDLVEALRPVHRSG